MLHPVLLHVACCLFHAASYLSALGYCPVVLRRAEVHIEAALPHLTTCGLMQHHMIAQCNALWTTIRRTAAAALEARAHSPCLPTGTIIGAAVPACAGSTRPEQNGSCCFRKERKPRKGTKETITREFQTSCCMLPGELSGILHII